MDSHHIRGASLLLLLVVCVVSHDASSHVAPAVKKNNRYIKLTVFPDSVRLAYVIYIGEIPGSAARARMDTNHDGVLSAGETATFASDWAKRVKDALSVPGFMTWESVDIGLGDDRVSGGAFSLDLVAWICVDPASPRLELRDTLNLPDIGETELLPEESPGTELTRVELAGQREPALRWSGPESPLEAGIVLEWTAQEPAIGKRCRGGAHGPSKRLPLVPIVLVPIALGLAVAVILGLRRRRKPTPVE